MYGFYLQSVRPNDWCDVDSFLKWYDTWKLAKKWGRESQFYILVIFFGSFHWSQWMFLKFPEGFQRFFSSYPETLLLPFTVLLVTTIWHTSWSPNPTIMLILHRSDTILEKLSVEYVSKPFWTYFQTIFLFADKKTILFNIAAVSPLY